MTSLLRRAAAAAGTPDGTSNSASFWQQPRRAAPSRAAPPDARVEALEESSPYDEWDFDAAPLASAAAALASSAGAARWPSASKLGGCFPYEPDDFQKQALEALTCEAEDGDGEGGGQQGASVVVSAPTGTGKVCRMRRSWRAARASG